MLSAGNSVFERIIILDRGNKLNKKKKITKQTITKTK